MTNFLIGVPSPFDYRLVEKYQGLLDYDIIKPRYYKEVEAYKIMRNTFLDHGEYSHLVFACSDVVIAQNHIERLRLDIAENPSLACITGYMNINLEYLDFYNITPNVVYPRQPVFSWYTDKTLPKEDIFEVKFSGFPIMCLKRSIVEKYEFQSTTDFTGDDGVYTGSLDTILCWRFHRDNIPIFVDKRIKTLHLRELMSESQPTLVGIKEPFTEFKSNGKLTVLKVNTNTS